VNLPGTPGFNPEKLSNASSDLNNLLQVIAGTTAYIEHALEGDPAAQEHLAVLRASIARAEKVASELVELAGGTNARELMRPDLAPRVRARKAPPSQAQARQSILVVDDEEITLSLVKRVLTDAGFEVTTAQSGFQAVDTLRRQPFGYELALIDLTMPFMDGEETFQRLREIRADLPIVLCTGFVEQERLERLMTAGLAGFLRKPIPPDEIVNFVRATLEKCRYLGDSPNALRPLMTA
jgi:CheY-like chemotaxis protein